MTTVREPGDTIFAVAAGGAGAALTVIRMSGPRSASILDRMCGRRPKPRHAGLRRLRDEVGETLDRGIVLWFPGPGSYTGEDAAELHLHGGTAVLTAVARAIVAAGGRPAEPGEFTRRAFLNGRMDLTEAEGVADLVAAETEAQRRQALRQMEGALGALYGEWSRRLIGIAGVIEASIDFADEGDVKSADAVVLADIRQLRAAILAHLDDGRRGERVREGLLFAIVGPPNVGKSSLMNALSGREAAIVSRMPGTTRDVVETRLDLDGVAVTLADTAGLRETADAIETEGIRRARAQAAMADLVIEVRAATDGDTGAALRPDAPSQDEKTLIVTNKVDLLPNATVIDIGVSAATGEGIVRLRHILAARARALVTSGADAPLTRSRHRAALREAAERLGSALEAPLPELLCEDIRLALRAIARITGRVGVKDVLDAVFARFCIGK